MRLVLAALALALLAVPAFALEFTAKEVGVSKSVEFGGVVNGRPVEGLSAKLTVKLLSASKDGKFRFSYTFRNTSKAPFTRARASLWGFDIPHVDHATSTAPFRFMGTGQTVGLGHRDVCFGAKSHDDCREGPGGVSLGASGAGTFGFGGAKGGKVTMENLFVRWVDLSAPSLKLQKASGYGLETVR